MTHVRICWPPNWKGEKLRGVKDVFRSETEFAFILYRPQFFTPARRLFRSLGTLVSLANFCRTEGQQTWPAYSAVANVNLHLGRLE